MQRKPTRDSESSLEILLEKARTGAMPMLPYSSWLCERLQEMVEHLDWDTRETAGLMLSECMEMESTGQSMSGLASQLIATWQNVLTHGELTAKNYGLLNSLLNEARRGSYARLAGANGRMVVTVAVDPPE